MTGKDRICRPISDIPGNIACEVPPMRSKANEAIASFFIGANVAPNSPLIASEFYYFIDITGFIIVA
jgi:hypothetical protein